jgi:hypothetical protein
MRFSLIIFILFFNHLFTLAQTQVLPVRVNGLWGAIDLNGKMIISPDYQFISQFNSLGLAIAQKNQKLGAINPQGKIIIPFEHLNLQFLGDSLLAFYANNAWGLKNYRNEILLQPEFDSFKIFKKDSSTNSRRMIIAQKGAKIGVISTQAKILYAPDLDEINFLSNQLIISRKGKFFGMKTLQGDEVLPLLCESISLKPYGILVKQQGKFGLLDEKGQLLIPFEFEQIIHRETNSTPKKEYFEVYARQKKGIYNLHGKKIVPALFDQIEDLSDGWFYEGFWKVRQNNLKGIYNKEGKEILKPDYEEVTKSGKRYFIFQKNGLWGVFDKENEQFILQAKYRSIKALEPFEQNRDYFIVSNNGNEYSVLDIKGQELIKSGDYDEIQYDIEGVFLVRQREKWGIVGKTNTFLSPQFDQISQFKRNLALVRNDKSLGLINIFGQIIARTNYPKIKMSGNTAKLFLPEKGVEYLTFNQDGTLIDRLKINQLQTISIKKTKTKPEELKQEDDWDFSFRKEEKEAIDTQKQTQRIELNNRTNKPLQIGKFVWFFDTNTQKWGLKDAKDSVSIKPVYRSVLVFPELNLTQVMLTQKTVNPQRDTIFVNSYGLINNDLAKVILPPSKISEANIRDILSDFNCGKYARMSTYFLTKEGKILNHLAFADKTPKPHLKPIVFADPFNHKGLSRVNIMGSFKPSFKGEAMTAHLIYGGYWGLINRAGENVLSPKYQKIEYLEKSSFVKIQQKGLWGVADSTGREIIPPQYAQINFLENTQQQYFLFTRQQMRFGYIDTTGFVCVDLKYRQVRPYQEKLGAVQDTNQLWTFVNEKGEKIHSPDFQLVRDFSEGLGAVKLKNHWGFLNTKGEIVIPNEYKTVGDFHCGRAWSMQKGKYGYISKSGTYKIPPQFEKVNDFQNNVAIVRQFGEDQHFGLIDTLGNWVIKPSFFKIDPFDNQGFARTYTSAIKPLIGLIHSSGKEITKPRFRAILAFMDNWAIVEFEDKWAFMDTSGKLLANRSFEKALPFSENLAGVKIKGYWGFIDKAGKIVIEPRFSQVSSFFNGLAEVVEGSKYYFINSSGQATETPPDSLNWRNLEKFRDVKPFSNGLSAFKKEGLWGFKNEADEIIIHPFYQQVSPFYNGYTKVRFFKNIFYLNKQGKSFPKIPNGIQWMDLEMPHFQIIKQNNKYGFASSQGFVLSYPKFTYLGEMQENRSPVAINEWLGIADLQGKIILSPDYERINYLGEGVFRLEKNDAIGYWHREKGWIWAMSK